MNRRAWSNADAVLLRADGPGLAQGHTVVVGPTASAGPALLDAGHGNDRRQFAVQLRSDPGLLPDEVVIGGQLADELGSGALRQWSLVVADAVPAASVVLESLVEGRLGALAHRIKRDPGLAGQVCRVGADAPPAWIDVADTPFRVRHATDAAGTAIDGLMRITPATRLHVFAPAALTGVDIVVLADCSSSMLTDDVPETAGSDVFLTRVKAVQLALLRMVEARQRTGGRAASLILASFGTSFRPVSAGPGDDLRPIRTAIGRLTAADEGTDIGNALHQAADLLHRRGRPGNDRLIVLISDGPAGMPSGADATGDQLAATGDPVSLVADLRQSLDITVDAVGVGDPAESDRRAETGGSAPEHSLRPDHRLLTDLTRAGGGVLHSGALDVMTGYFDELGVGVTHLVGVLSPVGAPPLQTMRETLVPRHRPVPPELARRCGELADIALSRRAGLAVAVTEPHRLLRISRPAVDRRSFDAWVDDMRHGFGDRWGADPAGGAQADRDGEWTRRQIALLNDLIAQLGSPAAGGPA